MTYECPDSIAVGNLPAGYPAYLGYVDGHWPTAAALRARFPGAHVITLTVLGGSAVADGCDIETGDLTAVSGAAWAADRISAGEAAPVLYADLDNWRSAVPAALQGHGINPARVRRFTAHYTGSPHLCGPACGISWIADATQYTDAHRTEAGDMIDMSLLASDFFTRGAAAPAPAPAPAPPSSTAPEGIVQKLPTIQQGATGEAVRTVQALCGARGIPVTVDGVFGPLTKQVVSTIQHGHRIAEDGIVGPATWPVLMGVA